MASLTGPLSNQRSRGGLDADGHALERDRKVFDALAGRLLFDHGPQPAVGMQVSAGAGEGAHLAEDRAGEDALGSERRPELGQPLHRLGGRGGGNRRAVQSPDRRPEHQVRGDPSLGQSLQHPDFSRAQQAAPAEHEGRLTGRRFTGRRGGLRPGLVRG